MTETGDNRDRLPLKTLSAIDDLCLAFEAAWQSNERPRLADYLSRVRGLEKTSLLRELLLLEVDYRRRLGEQPVAADYAAQFGDSIEIVQEAMRSLETERSAHNCDERGAVDHVSAATQDHEQPPSIGRYRIIEKLSSGGFGTVYKGYDSELDRSVAIKVPKLRRRQSDKDVDMFLAEARLIARLNHPRIVPVHDAGRLEDSTFYVVSKYMEGGDLSAQVRRQRLRHEDAARVVADIADALEHAHAKGIVHRDVKLSNILIDSDGNVALADFGLAIPGLSGIAGLVGTPIAMSPEQARGESHLVDRRSDVYSLGVVLFELLTGVRPFASDNIVTLLDAIKHVDPPQLRELDPQVPIELERICLRAMAKRSSDRFATAVEMGNELRQFLRLPTAAYRMPAESHRSASTKSTDEPHPIIPQGIRSYDQADASFFLQMVPGPRDLMGLPQSVRLWKSRIEARGAESFRVALLYGPSGAGKTSFVKAGVLPRLSSHIRAVYVEAKPQGTEAELLHRLRSAVTDLPRTGDLLTSFQWIRDRGVGSDAKIVVILDQFEQWLHMHSGGSDCELALALRQSDGVAIQTVVMVRDDFWMPVTRFMHELEIPLREGRNCAAVDLFDEQHAEEVLRMLGRAYGRLPDGPESLSKKQNRFVELAVSALSVEGRIVPLYLSLFAEMIKSRPWEPKTLQEVGGPEGLGVAFLEETFSSGRRSPAHRFHHRAARAVLSYLLPQRGMELRGGNCTVAQLQSVAGYEHAPERFAELIEILDRELHLITPVDSGFEKVNSSNQDIEVTPDEGMVDQRVKTPCDVQQERFDAAYQLTHDFLVPSIREWVARERTGSRVGRAEALLHDLAEVWSTRKESKYLPAFLEWLRICALTKRRHWKECEREMMASATKHHVLRAIVGIAGGLLLAAVVADGFGRREALARVNALLAAEPGEASKQISGLKLYRRWALPLLNQYAQDAPPGDRRRTRAVLGLLEFSDRHVQMALEELLHAEPREFGFVSRQMARHRQDILPQLWELWKPDTNAPLDVQLRAISALALYDATDDQLALLAPRIAALLVQQDPSTTAYWFEALRPLEAHLRQPLTQRVREHADPPSTLVATSALVDLCDVSVATLVELLPDMSTEQIRIVMPRLRAESARAIELLGRGMQVADDRELAQTLENVSSLDSEVIGIIEQADGLVSRQCVIVQTLPWNQLPRVLAAMRAGDYVPKRLRPYLQDGSVQVAALFVRDQAVWQASLGRTKAEVVSELASFQQREFSPIDVAGYLEPNASGLQSSGTGEATAEERYCVVWQASSGDIQVRCTVGETADEHRRSFRQLRDESYAPSVRHQFVGADGQLVYSTLWESPKPGEWSVLTDSDWARRDLLRDKGYVIQDVAICGGNEGHLSVGVVAAVNDQWEFGELSAEDAASHLDQCKAMVLQQYRPASLSVTYLPSQNKTHAVSIWHRAMSANEPPHRRASRAAVLYALGDLGSIRQISENSDDAARLHLPRLLGSLVEHEQLVEQLNAPLEPLTQQIVLLALAQSSETMRPSTAHVLQTHVNRLYSEHPSAAIHAAAHTLASRHLDWNSARMTPTPDENIYDRSWFVNGLGMVMNIIHSTESKGGVFAVADRETTVAQYSESLPDRVSAEGDSHGPNRPVSGVSWLDAIAYCHALNLQEGVPETEWCYLPPHDESDSWSLPADHLIRTGYRLPTHHEWKQIANQGLAKLKLDEQGAWHGYAWLATNSSGRIHPVATCYPDSGGFFDLVGNVVEWLHEPLGHTDDEPIGSESALEGLVAGGDYGMSPWDIRLRRGESYRLGMPKEQFGFRVARLLKPSANDCHTVGVQLARAGRWNDAERQLKRAIDLDPQQSEWLFEVGHIAFYLGNRPLYDEACERALARYREQQPISVHSIALLYFLGSPAQEVALDLASSLQQQPVLSAPLRRSYATALLHAGRVDEAKAEFQELSSRGLVSYSQMANELALAIFWKSQRETERGQLHFANFERILQDVEASRSPHDYGDTWRSWLSVQNMKKQFEAIKSDE